MLMFALAALPAHAADPLACRVEATVQDALGVESVNGVLYASCMQTGSADPTPLNSWMRTNSCPVSLAAFHRAANAHAHTCRLSAVELDPSGHPRVNRATVRHCMAEAGFQSGSRKRVVAWAEGCRSTVAAREATSAEHAGASRGSRPRTLPPVGDP